MLRIGVKLPFRTARLGDYLADVSALEAAGADSIWLDAKTDTSLEPWILLGAIAGATHRVRLGVEVDSAAEWQPQVDILDRLCGGRASVAVTAGPDLGRRIELMRAMRPESHGPSILSSCNSFDEAQRSALGADGVVLAGTDQEVRDLRAERSDDEGFELWVDIPLPPDRAGWAKTLSDFGAAGATGLIVSWNPRIVDLLRNAGDEDDRTDLLIATG